MGFFNCKKDNGRRSPSPYGSNIASTSGSSTRPSSKYVKDPYSRIKYPVAAPSSSSQSRRESPPIISINNPYRVAVNLPSSGSTPYVQSGNSVAAYYAGYRYESRCTPVSPPRPLSPLVTGPSYTVPTYKHDFIEVKEQQASITPHGIEALLGEASSRHAATSSTLAPGAGNIHYTVKGLSERVDKLDARVADQDHLAQLDKARAEGATQAEIRLKKEREEHQNLKQQAEEAIRKENEQKRENDQEFQRQAQEIVSQELDRYYDQQSRESERRRFERGSQRRSNHQRDFSDWDAGSEGGTESVRTAATPRRKRTTRGREPKHEYVTHIHTVDLSTPPEIVRAQIIGGGSGYPGESPLTGGGGGRGGPPSSGGGSISAVDVHYTRDMENGMGTKPCFTRLVPEKGAWSDGEGGRRWWEPKDPWRR